MLLDRKRIMVIGSGGAGKSTFARELAGVTGLPLIHLDQYFWHPGWIPTPPDEWLERVRQLSSGDAWIIDGNYGGSLSPRVQRCDAIVFFDLPRLTCVGGVLQRWLRHRFRPRADLPEGCPEKIDREFLRWVWDYPRDSRPRIAAALQEAGPDVEVVTLARRAQARTLLSAMRNQGRSSSAVG
jgi:adenylate kinase family enzyme